MASAAVKVRATAATRGAELRPMLSRFRGKCETCGKPINRGSPIGWSRRCGANHAACVGLDGDAIKAAALDGLGAVVETMRAVHSLQEMPAVAEFLSVDGPAGNAGDPFGDDVWAGLELAELAVAS